MNTHSYVLATLFLALTAAGCSKETTSSSNIKTAGIAALIDVNAVNDTQATVHVELVVGGSSSNTYVTLEGGDTLVAIVGTSEKTLQAIDTGVYEANFSGVAEDTEFKVELRRPNDTPATDNHGTLPSPFTLTAPTADLSRATDDLVATWTPSGKSDPFILNFSGTCIFDKGVDVAGDPGTQTVAKGTLESTGGNTPEACDIKLSAERSRAGTKDSAFDPESWFKLHQNRAVSFTSKP